MIGKLIRFEVGLRFESFSGAFVYPMNNVIGRMIARSIHKYCVLLRFAKESYSSPTVMNWIIE